MWHHLRSAAAGFKMPDMHTHIRKHTHTQTVSSSSRCNMHTHPSVLCRDRIHSCLRGAKSKMVPAGRHGEHDMSSLRFSSWQPLVLVTPTPSCLLHNLLESPACHRPGLLACHGADQPCVAATWRPVWQLTSITVTLSHSSFSRPHHEHDLLLGKWWTLGQRFRTWTPLFSWLKSQTRFNSIFNFTENEWLSYNDRNFPNLSESPSLALQIIIENGSLVIQPEGKKASKMSLYLAVFDNQGHLDGWPLCCSGYAWTANMCIGVHWSKPPADTEQARGDRLAARRALTGHSF